MVFILRSNKPLDIQLTDTDDRFGALIKKSLKADDTQ